MDTLKPKEEVKEKEEIKEGEKEVVKEEKVEVKPEEKETKEEKIVSEKKEKLPKSILDPEEKELSQTISQGNSVVKNDTEETSQKSTNPLIIVAITASLVVFISIGIILFNNYRNSSVSQETSEEETITEIPQETLPPSTLVKSAVTFEVLNASSVAGLARKEADKIEALGYKIGKVGNYSGDVTQNELYLSSDLVQESATIFADLKDLKIASVSGEIKNASNSARLILFSE